MPLISWSTFGNMRLTNGSQRTNRTTNSSSTRGRRNPITFRSTQGTTGSRTTMETGNTAISTYVGRSFDSTLLAPMFRQLSLDTVSLATPSFGGTSNLIFCCGQVKYFVCRSINEADVALCFAHSRWTAMPAANKRLDNGYKRTDGNVLIFFSVVGRCV
jgi:hypothetical protein